MTDDGRETMFRDILARRDGQALLKLAEAGDLLAMRNVAAHYMSGEHVLLPEDPRQAVYWWQQLVDAGDTSAMFELALMFVDNRYGLEDRERARRLLTIAAEAGNRDAADVLLSEGW
jgi:TPR repeat protein